MYLKICNILECLIAELANGKSGLKCCEEKYKGKGIKSENSLKNII